MLTACCWVSVTSLAIWLWLNEAGQQLAPVAGVPTGWYCACGVMSQWESIVELSALFRKHRTVQDGINSHLTATDCQDVENAPELEGGSAAKLRL